MRQGGWVLLVVLALASAFGGWRARRGRFRGTRLLADPAPSEPGGDGAADPIGQPTLDRAIDPTAGLAAELGEGLGERGTLLQFSSAFCAPCRATRRVLGEVAGLVPGVRHVEVDAEEHLELVRRLGIARTPTTLVLDAAGREVSRASGAPTRDAVLATLGRVLEG